MAAGTYAYGSGPVIVNANNANTVPASGITAGVAPAGVGVYDIGQSTGAERAARISADYNIGRSTSDIISGVVSVGTATWTPASGQASYAANSGLLQGLTTTQILAAVPSTADTLVRISTGIIQTQANNLALSTGTLAYTVGRSTADIISGVVSVGTSTWANKADQAAYATAAGVSGSCSGASASCLGNAASATNAGYATNAGGATTAVTAGNLVAGTYTYDGTAGVTMIAATAGNAFLLNGTSNYVVSTSSNIFAGQNYFTNFTSMTNTQVVSMGVSSTSAVAYNSYKLVLKGSGLMTTTTNSMSNCPVMTSANTPSPFAVTDSSHYSATSLAWGMFQATPTNWYTVSGTTTGWVKIDYGDVGAIAVSSYTLQCPELLRAPTTWTLQASDDDTNYATLDTQIGVTNWGANGSKGYAISNTTKYRFYKFVFTANNGDPNFLGLSTIKMYNNYQQIPVDKKFSFFVSVDSGGVPYPEYHLSVQNNANTEVLGINGRTGAVSVPGGFGNNFNAVGTGNFGTALYDSYVSIQSSGPTGSTLAFYPGNAQYFGTNAQIGMIHAQSDYGNNGVTFSNAAAYIKFITGRSAWSTGQIVFGTNGSDSTNGVGSDKMRIAENGYVGINNANPQYLLDVSGSENIVGPLYVQRVQATQNLVSSWGVQCSTFQMTNGCASGDLLQGDTTGYAVWISSKQIQVQANQVQAGVIPSGVSVYDVGTATQALNTAVYNIGMATQTLNTAVYNIGRSTADLSYVVAVATGNVPSTMTQTTFSTACYVSLSANTTYTFDMLFVWQSTATTQGPRIAIGTNVTPIFLQALCTVPTSATGSSFFYHTGPCQGGAVTATITANFPQQAWLYGQICTGVSSTTMALLFTSSAASAGKGLVATQQSRIRCAKEFQ